MRPWLLLVLLPLASADDTAAAVNSGDWRLGVLLQFDTFGHGAWSEAKAGATARFERTTVAPTFDPTGRTKPTPTVDEEECRVVKGEGGRLVLRTRRRPSDEHGKPGKWENSGTDWPLPGVCVAVWKIERVGDTTYRLDRDSVAATAYRVRFPWARGEEEVWSVVANDKLGVLQARRETGDQIEWSLSKTDVEVEVGKRKLSCRVYEFRWKPPPDMKALVTEERRMYLCPDVPGYVVRQTYSMLGARIEETITNFNR